MAKSKHDTVDAKAVDKKELATIPEKSPVPALTYDEVKKYFDPQGKCSDSEIGMFIKICQATGLNPFLKEAYLIKYAGSPAQIITGYEAYLKRAERSGLWNGEKCWTEGEGANLKACIEIYRKGWDKPLYHEVYLREYQGSSNPLWKTKPITMIKKVVTAQAYRRAFPEAVGGLPYTNDEINADQPKELPGKPVVTSPEALSPEIKPTEAMPKPSAPKLPDWDAEIVAVIKKRGLTKMLVCKTLSAEFGREIKSKDDLSLIEKEEAVKILKGEK